MQRDFPIYEDLTEIAFRKCEARRNPVEAVINTLHDVFHLSTKEDAKHELLISIAIDAVSIRNGETDHLIRYWNRAFTLIQRDKPTKVEHMNIYCIRLYFDLIGLIREDGKIDVPGYRY